MRCCRTIAALVLLVLFGTCPMGQSAEIKRLILTDGTFELIREFSIQGDRVRYFSTERNAWEELPSSMIDWDATEKYAGRATDEATGRVNAELAKAAEEKKEEDARLPLIASGLRLPSPDGLFLLDVYQGKPVLAALVQSEADLNKNTKSNILRGVVNPVASSRQTVELNGPHAQIQSHAPVPVIYFPIDAADSSAKFDAASAKDRFRIVRCEMKKGNRVVAVYNIAVYGKVKQKADYIEIQIQPVSDYWVKIMPAAPMKPGEYALTELDDKGNMNLFVWDFGVNPEAPPNPVAASDNPERKEPILIQKPQKKPTP